MTSDVRSREICPGGVGFETRYASGGYGAVLVANLTRSVIDGVSVLAVGIRLGLQFSKPHDKHGNVNGEAPLFPPQNGRAKVPVLLIILGESHAQSRDEIQPRTNEGIHPDDARVAFSGVADGGLAGAGDDWPILAGDEP